MNSFVFLEFTLFTLSPFLKLLDTGFEFFFELVYFRIPFFTGSLLEADHEIPFIFTGQLIKVQLLVKCDVSASVVVDPVGKARSVSGNFFLAVCLLRDRCENRSRAV